MARRLSGADDRRAKLRKKAQEEVDNAGKEGKWKSIVNIDDDVSWYKPVDANHKNNYQINKIDIIPFIIETENHPDVRKSNGSLKVGDPDYELDIHIHYNMGVNADEPVLCLAKTYGERCPICEDRSRMFDLSNKDEKLIAKLKPRHRVFYNVIDKSSDDDSSLIWDSSAFLFKEEMAKKLKIIKARGGGELTPPDWEEGCTICFTGEMTKVGSDFEFIKYGDFEFKERDYTYPDPASKEGKENAYSLDKYISPLTYEEVWRIYYGEEMGDAAEDKEIPDHIAIRKEHKIDDEETQDQPDPENPCPGGYKFGADNQQHDMCSGSEVDGKVCDDDTFNACEKAKDEDKAKTTRGRR